LVFTFFVDEDDIQEAKVRVDRLLVGNFINNGIKSSNITTMQ
jgi:hypothetical protein